MFSSEHQRIGEQKNRKEQKTKSEQPKETSRKCNETTVRREISSHPEG
jgi:hypothetical protein